jgi:MoaA/NifB/PqqE/SkfB family radical SAM enzyme
MNYDLQTIRIFLTGFLQSPLKTAAELGLRLLHAFKEPAQVGRLQQMTREAPIILQIETINVCNAACVFCAYPGMKRQKGVMSLPLFEKIVREYAEMGGGAVSLTPLVGDALLDPHLMDRLRILAAQPAIKQVSVTTNGIALDRFSDDDVRHLLETLYCIQVSIGGLDAATYEMMYGVDRFSQVQQAMERLLSIRDSVRRPASISFAFRTNDARFEARFGQLLDGYRQRGVFISHIWTYANFSGLVKDDEQLKLVVLRSKEQKRRICTYPAIAMSICWDGKITACGCADFEGNQLTIGHAEQATLAEAGSGTRRSAILDSFPKGTPAGICRQCSAYQPDTIFASPCFSGIQPHQPLPLEFYRQFWGG